MFFTILRKATQKHGRMCSGDKQLKYCIAASSNARAATECKAGKVWSLLRFWNLICTYKQKNSQNIFGWNIGPCLAQIPCDGPECTLLIRKSTFCQNVTVNKD